MAKWNFNLVGSSLVKELDTTGADVLPRSQSFMQPSFDLGKDYIVIKESGQYKTSIVFSQIGEIDGVAPTDLQDAYTKLLAIVPSSSGGGSGGSYNTPTIYDTPADLPIEFASGTIHSISILAVTGTTTITVDGEETILSEGQEYVNEASTLIDVVISIDSTTGTFIATTLN